MTRILPLLVFLASLCPFYSKAQHCNWLRGIKGDFYDDTYSVGFDPSGNVVVFANSWSSNVHLQDSVFTPPSGDTANIFIAKYTPTGQLLWGRYIPFHFDYYYPYRGAVDDQGNIFIAGQFRNATVTVDSITLSNISGGDLFLAKLDSNGHTIWIKQLSSVNYYSDGIASIAIDRGGNPVILGQYVWTITVAGTTFTNSAATYDSYSTFVAKFNTNGDLIWAKSSGSATSGCPPSCMTTDGDDNIIIAGYFTDSVRFDSQKLISASASGSGFVAKFTPDGSATWIRAVNSYGINGISADSAGNFFITGSFNSAYASFGSWLLYNHGGSTGTDDAFLAKYNSDGICSWAKNFGSLHDDYGHNVATDPDGLVYMTGFVDIPIAFATDSLHYGGMFLAKFDGDGNEKFVKGVSNGDYSNNIYPTAIARDRSGTIVVAGMFIDSLILDTCSLHKLDTSSNYSDIFIATFSDATLGVASTPAVTPALKIYPSPTSTTLHLELDEPITNISITDMSGRELVTHSLNDKHASINVSTLSPGVYTVTINHTIRRLFTKL